jgi:hypothetical protein
MRQRRRRSGVLSARLHRVCSERHEGRLRVPWRGRRRRRRQRWRNKRCAAACFAVSERRSKRRVVSLQLRPRLCVGGSISGKQRGCRIGVALVATQPAAIAAVAGTLLLLRAVADGRRRRHSIDVSRDRCGRCGRCSRLISSSCGRLGRLHRQRRGCRGSISCCFSRFRSNGFSGGFGGSGSGNGLLVGSSSLLVLVLLRSSGIMFVRAAGAAPLLLLGVACSALERRAFARCRLRQLFLKQH